MMDLRSLVPFLAVSGRERFKQVPVRVALTGVTSWGLYASGSGAWVPHWVAFATAVQIFEIWAMLPLRRVTDTAAEDAGEPDVGTFQILLALSSTTLMATAHAGMALWLWQTGLPVLATLAALTLSGGLLTNIASGIGSRAIFLIATAPYLLALFTMPLLLIGRGNVTDLVMMYLINLLGVGSIMNVYIRVYAMRRVEVLAHRNAEHRLEQAQAAMADRAAMAAIISHELRTPVSAIVAGAEIIRSEDSQERRQETADLIIDAGQLMTGMLNDLLDHSKMEAGAMQLAPRNFELGSFIRDTARFWTAPAGKKGLAIEVTGGTAEPIWLKGDAFRLRQIINNLMSNAVKFTSEGTIRLAVAAVQEGETVRLEMSVTDQGVGISPEAMERLFTPFAQASAEVARTYGGSGLGLTVSRELARLMGGDVSATSVEGEGATFSLRIALPIGQPTSDDDGAANSAPVLAERIRVLAVDDHEINRRTIALVLQPLQVDLMTASGGQEALTLLDQGRFDVVLMDVNMPGLDGNQTTRRLRSGTSPNRDVPVIGFSAGTEDSQVKACFDAGMTDWLAKPLEPRKLYDALQRATQKSAA